MRRLVECFPCARCACLSVAARRTAWGCEFHLTRTGPLFADLGRACFGRRPLRRARPNRTQERRYDIAQRRPTRLLTIHCTLTRHDLDANSTTRRTRYQTYATHRQEHDTRYATKATGQTLQDTRHTRLALTRTQVRAANPITHTGCMDWRLVWILEIRQVSLAAVRWRRPYADATDATDATRTGRTCRKLERRHATEFLASALRN